MFHTQYAGKGAMECTTPQTAQVCAVTDFEYSLIHLACRLVGEG